MSNVDPDIHVNLFADDTAISIQSNSVVNALPKINFALDKLSSFLNKRSLIVNESKTKVLVMGGGNEVSDCILKLNGKNLEIVENIKYLGVIIDNKLNFKPHMDKTINKITQKVNYFRRIIGALNLRARLLIYKSMIAPHFQYCPTILYFARDSDIKRMQLQQNRAMRLILNCDNMTSIILM